MKCEDNNVVSFVNGILFHSFTTVAMWCSMFSDVNLTEFVASLLTVRKCSNYINYCSNYKGVRILFDVRARLVSDLYSNRVEKSWCIGYRNSSQCGSTSLSCEKTSKNGPLLATSSGNEELY